MREVTRIHASSGTTGKPTVVAYTCNGVELWADLIARCYASAGVTEHDVVHNAYGYGLFTGGLGLHYGVCRTMANEGCPAALPPYVAKLAAERLAVGWEFGGEVVQDLKRV